VVPSQPDQSWLVVPSQPDQSWLVVPSQPDQSWLVVPWQPEPCTQQERHMSPLLYESTLLGIHLQRRTALKLLYSALLVPSM
jgi:hypothetical protein